MNTRVRVAMATLALAAGLTQAGTALAQPAVPKAKGYESATPDAKRATQQAPDLSSEAESESGGAHWEPVLFITGVEVMRSTRGRPLDIVRVYGLTSSNGWGDPQLVPITRGPPKNGVLELLLVAQPLLRRKLLASPLLFGAMGLISKGQCRANGKEDGAQAGGHRDVLHRVEAEEDAAAYPYIAPASCAHISAYCPSVATIAVFPSWRIRCSRCRPRRKASPSRGG